MFRADMPRVFELRDLIEEPQAPEAYFQDFELTLCDGLAREIWLAREREFQLLDAASWEALKEEARPYLTRHDPGGRGWSQLINILNQARAHNHLAARGCSGVAFVPRGKKPTPDLEGTLNDRKVLCEVKSINISAEEAERRNTRAVGSITASLDGKFLKKLTSTLCKAKSQMLAYDNGAACIAFIIIDFDDFLGQYKADYYAQIDQHLESEPVQGIEIVIYNQRTAFHPHITMRSAFVVNEAAWPKPEPSEP
ncbi:MULTISPECIES: hypothetical protein [Burkholderia]|uniref:hypothetical protein n=1 Tax=Burkholderia TaxID=32008 RepID=UPI00158C53C8|nr:hypothetical protein [Burkholderia cepacia]MCA8060006.1 hypothetical protein [Burkholderia cepacia]MCA8137262.1 hypothetical protein [Burkholderia cepacia]MCA8163347.1 hypothetical protein [Burkholderia cepacia]HEM7888945.1 hypothetical protein [Burkholderia cepacia]HEM8513924.1 hypothetical protein [Burkholderia cepacia]